MGLTFSRLSPSLVSLVRAACGSLNRLALCRSSTSCLLGKDFVFAQSAIQNQGQETDWPDKAGHRFAFFVASCALKLRTAH